MNGLLKNIFNLKIIMVRDMTNFGHRSQEDENFNKMYQQEMKKFKEKVLNDDTFAKKIW